MHWLGGLGLAALVFVLVLACWAVVEMVARRRMRRRS